MASETVYKHKGEDDEETSLLGYHPRSRRQCNFFKTSALVAVIFVTGMFLADGNLWNSQTSNSGEESKDPHIVLFLTDDQGFNDIGYQSTDLTDLTPHIDALAETGTILSWFYSNHVCTPSRASLMTGLYPSHLGMQHSIVSGTHMFGLPLELVTMPQIMKRAGYNTLMLGKWHLGHYTTNHVPTSRGFDNFFGFYSGFQDHFTHISESTICQEPACYYDLRYGTETVDTSTLSDDAAYGPNLWRNEATEFIETYDTSVPLFLYYAESLVHEPVEAPDYIFTKYEALLSTIPNVDRRGFGAMTIYLDEVVHNLTEALRARGMWDNTVFIYCSDNGGDAAAIGSGSNVPLRGRKMNLFEGGVRVPAFIHSQLLPSKVQRTRYDYMFHISDWLPTIVHGIISRKDLLDDLSTAQGSLDGVNHWSAIREGSDSSTDDNYPSKAPRTEILVGMDYLNFDDEWTGYDTAAVIVGYDKLITNEVNETWWPIPGVDIVTREPLFTMTGTPVYTYLFNLRDDPEERVDLSLLYPEKVEELKLVLASYHATMVDSMYCPTVDPIADTILSEKGFVAPWTTTDETCPLRVLATGEEQVDFNPSFLSDD